MEALCLTARDLACRRGERLLFRGLSLDLAGGEACHVTGPNGSGKSSLIRILARLLRPYAGKVEREGSIGLLDQTMALDEHLPLGRALAFWRGLDGAISGDALAQLGLSDLLDVPVRYLSTGQRKRAALARLLGQDARIWLLDEPLNGLDRDAVGMVETLVAEHIAQGGLALVASHQPIAVPGMSVLHLPDYAPGVPA
ncbi:heme ABC exporter ATP-binding protein CcmA [Aurantiacibacter poecillastricola]|uniref:heme ABC exporter ATP-binding protein CcmA n=1 Tax=Aurantiacibacter poecillastricola TaxID=3064385 RepID=UPI00273D7B0A|nr:heme ABC exporter ATP-binding protein CcmA [Aurantiacibacter sp. 219JJ12-13]MDP5262865.1 heme ABC exporter ATP-binding protein CcmA [Aurantiacibacter sp. 219JJ12-13]